MAGGKRRTGAWIAAAAGIGAIAVAAIAASRWPDLYLRWHGYRIVWAPPGLSPVGRIDAAGQVAVTFYDSAGRERAGRWSIFTGEVVAIGPFPDEIKLINHLTVGESGSVIGTARNGDESLFPFFWTEAGGLQVIGGPEETTQDVNAKDEVVIDASPGAAEPCRAFIWRPGKGREDLGLTTVWLIDDRGWTVTSEGDLTLRKGGSGEKIAVGRHPKLGRGYARAIDGRGRILVDCKKEASSTGRALDAPFLWSEAEGWADVPIPAGCDGAYAYGLDDRGEILLGGQKRGKGEGEHDAWFLVKDGKPVRLPVPPGWDRASYGGMSRTGLLCGRAARGPWMGPSESRYFVLVPVR